MVPLMGKLVLPGSKVAVVAGMLRAEDHRKKADGFIETFPRYCAGGKIIKIIEGHEDEDETFQKASELLRQVPDVAGIYVNTVNCLPVCRALGATGLAGKVKARLDENASRTYQNFPASAVVLEDTALLHSAQEELLRGIRGMLARSLRIEPNLPRNAAIVLGTLTAVQKLIPGLHPPTHLREDAFGPTNTRDHESSVSSSRQKTTAALCMAYFPC
jgi:hypothetical protein